MGSGTIFLADRGKASGRSSFMEEMHKRNFVADSSRLFV